MLYNEHVFEEQGLFFSYFIKFYPCVCHNTNICDLKLVERHAAWNFGLNCVHKKHQLSSSYYLSIVSIHLFCDFIVLSVYLCPLKSRPSK